MFKHVLRAVDCLFLGRLRRQSQFISSMSEAQGGGLIRDQFPPNTTPARRESQRCYGGDTITECRAGRYDQKFISQYFSKLYRFHGI